MAPRPPRSRAGPGRPVPQETTPGAPPRPIGRASPVRKKPSLDFSLTGLIYTCMMLFMGLAAINSQANLLFAVFGLMIGVLLVSGSISRLVLRKLDMRRVLPEYVVVGRPATFLYEFSNRKRIWPSLSVIASELNGTDGFVRQPQAYLLHAAAGTRATVPTQVVPRCRGLHQLDRYQLLTSFPFGFIRRAVQRRQLDGVLVHPPMAEVDPAFLEMCLSAEQSGARMRPQRGGTDEFYGLKEFRTGESPRWIYWRRSARTGTLVTKEMTRVAPPRLLIFVDSFVEQHTPAELAAVERAIAMAASLVVCALEEGMAVGLCAWSGQWTSVPPSRGKRHSRELLAVLSRLPLNRSQPLPQLLEHGRHLLRPATTAALFTPHSQPAAGVIPRGNWLVVPAPSAQADGWFRFDGQISFEQCIPPDHLPQEVRRRRR